MTSPKTSHKNKADLAPNDETFRLLFANHPIPMWVYDLKTLAFLDVNDAALEKYGYTRDEFLKLTIKDIRPEEDVERLINNLKQKRPSLQHSGEWRHRLKNGQVIDVEITSHTLDFKGYKAMLVMAQEITQRKQAEKALRDSELRFRSLIEHGLDNISLLAADGSLLWESPAVVHALGYEYDHFKGRNIFELMHPDDMERAQLRFREIVSKPGNVIHSAFRLKHFNGSWRWMEGTGTNLLHVPSINAVVINYRDITESKLAEDALKESARSLARAQRIGKLGDWDWDVEGNSLTWSDEMYRIWGVGKDFALTFENIAGMIHPDDRELNSKMVQEFLAQSNEGGFEFRIICPDGTIKYIYQSIEVTRAPDGQPIKMFGIMQDITERRRAENELRESEEKYRQIVDTAGEGVWMIDAEGNTTFANQKMTEMLGYSAGEMLGVSFFTFMDEDGKALAAANVERRRQGIKEQHDFKFRRKDGTDLWVILETNPIFDKDERYAGALAMITDITKRKQVEKALHESEERLRLANKATNDVIWDWDIVNDSQQWNEAGTVVFGWSDIVESPQPATWWVERVHPEDCQRVENSFFVVTADPARNYWHDEYRFRKMDGSYAQVIDRGYVLRNAQGEAVRMIGAMQDITERKRIENALRESQHFIQRIADTVPSQLYVFDLAKKHNVYINRTSEEFFGHSLAEIQAGGQDLFFELLHPDDKYKLSEFNIQWDSAQDGQIFEKEYRLRNAGGEYRAIRSYESVLNRGPDGTPAQILGMAMDITERKRAEEALRESEKRFRTLVEQAPTAIFIQTHGQFAYINKAGLTLFGAESEDQLLGQPVLDRFHSKVREQVLERIRQLNEQRKVVPNAEETIIKLDGSSAETEVSAVPFYFKGEHGALVFVRDITERKQTEAKLKESEENFRLIAETIREVFYTYDPRADKFLYVSPAYETLWQEPVQKVCDDPLSFTYAVHPEDRERFFAAVRREREDGEYFNMQYRIVRPDMTVRHVHSRNYPIFDASGAEYRVVGIAEDITIRKRAEEEILKLNVELEQRVEARTNELRETQEKLVRNEKLAVLGQLAGGVGHELRNPLAVINNALYYLKLVGTNNEEKFKEYLGIIQAETRSAEKIITDLLDFARIKSVDVEPVSASRLVESVLERFPAPKEVRVKLEVLENVPMLYVDPRHAEQVLGNLVVNACQAMMPSGGELTITAQQEQGMIAIAVQDTGVGITPENMKNLFEPLFTTKAKGIGLGLAVSRKLAEANGGRMEVRSEVGAGSTFTVWLPVHRG